MITAQAIENFIAKNFPNATIHVEGDGYHFIATVTCSSFESQSQVKRQQRVYACVADQIASGEIHALTVKALTPGA